jgi:hypothetical protein
MLYAGDIGFVNPAVASLILVSEVSCILVEIVVLFRSAVLSRSYDIFRL